MKTPRSPGSTYWTDGFAQQSHCHALWKVDASGLIACVAVLYLQDGTWRARRPNLPASSPHDDLAWFKMTTDRPEDAKMVLEVSLRLGT